MAFEHLVQPRESFTCAGKENYPTRRTIQTVSYAQEDFSGFIVLLFDVRLDGLRKRCVAGFIALHDLVAGLVDGYNMVIFV
jgi:hypothetical protein